MNNKMTVAVIVTTFQRNDRLGACVTALLSQSLLPNKIYVVHDGPSDACRDFLTEAFEAPMRQGVLIFCETPQWSGRPAPARNYGFAISQEDLIAFCDDDDIWMRDKLESQVSVLSDNPKADGVFSGYIPFYEGEEVGLLSQFRDGASAPFRRVELLEYLDGKGLCMSSSLLRSSSLNNLRFNESKFVKAFEDYIFWLDLILSKKELLVTDEPALFYLTNNSQSIRKGKIQHNLRLMTAVFLTLIRYERYATAVLSPLLRSLYVLKKFLRVRTS